MTAVAMSIASFRDNRCARRWTFVAPHPADFEASIEEEWRVLLWLADVAQLYVSNDSLELTVRANTGPGSQVNAKTTVTLSSRLVGRWMHVALSLDEQRARVHIDGSLVLDWPIRPSLAHIKAMYLGKPPVVDLACRCAIFNST